MKIVHNNGLVFEHIFVGALSCRPLNHLRWNRTHRKRKRTVHLNGSQQIHAYKHTHCWSDAREELVTFINTLTWTYKWPANVLQHDFAVQQRASPRLFEHADKNLCYVGKSINSRNTTVGVRHSYCEGREEWQTRSDIIAQWSSSWACCKSTNASRSEITRCLFLQKISNGALTTSNVGQE